MAGIRRAVLNILNDRSMDRPDFLRSVAIPADNLHLRGRIRQTGVSMYHALIEGPGDAVEAYLLYLLVGQPIIGSVCNLIRTNIAAYSVGDCILLTVPIRDDIETDPDFERLNADPDAGSDDGRPEADGFSSNGAGPDH